MRGRLRRSRSTAPARHLRADRRSRGRPAPALPARCQRSPRPAGSRQGSGPAPAAPAAARATPAALRSGSRRRERRSKAPVRAWSSPTRPGGPWCRTSTVQRCCVPAGRARRPPPLPTPQRRPRPGRRASRANGRWRCRPAGRGAAGCVAVFYGTGSPNSAARGRPAHRTASPGSCRPARAGLGRRRWLRPFRGRRPGPSVPRPRWRSPVRRQTPPVVGRSRVGARRSRGNSSRGRRFAVPVMVPCARAAVVPHRHSGPAYWAPHPSRALRHDEGSPPMTSTATALTTTLPVAWWRRRGKAPRGAGQPDAMLLWCDPEAGPQLVAAYRGQSGLMLSADASLLSKEAGEAFTEAAPARAFADVAYLQVDDEGPTHEQLVQLLEGSPPAASMLGDLEGSVQAALAVPELEATPDPEPVQPSPSSTPASFAGPLESVPLRDGRVYRPRPVGDTTDVQILRQARGSLFTRIVGASGNGKTMLAEAAFGEDLIVVEGHGDLAVDDLVGKWIPREDGPGYRFAYGPLAEAMRQGKVLLIDDLTRAPSDTINVLMGPADDRRMLVIDALPDEPVLHAADGFHIVVTYNQTGVGVRPLDAAILRRFPLQLEATTDYGLVAELGVDARLVRVGRLLAARAAVAGQSGRRPGWAPQTDHLLKSQKALDMGMGVQVAASMLFAACPEPQHQPEVLDVLVEVFGSPVGPLVQQELQ
ncbi:hypothetical protein C3V38_16625 (plasmid) [Dietzia sp. oral taxon 368]|nr:hypothetical protein C3V38_16625 [Dietzia sp. oral taxon 368]